MDGKIERDLIYDVGLHKGEDSEFYLKKGFRVVAIEANPTLTEIATERLREYVEAGKLVILNVAIAKKDGPLTFFANTGNSVLGTAYPDWAEKYRRIGHRSVPISVPGVNFAQILRQHGIPYYLKVDIEGADILCLEALRNFNRPKYLSIESSKTSWRAVLKEFALLKTLGYSKFKVVPQHATTSQVCPFPALEGQYVDHRFEEMSSGLFGEEAPGRWMSGTKALSIYCPILLRQKLMGEAGLAYRIPLAERVLRRLEMIPQFVWYDTHAAA